MHISKLFSFSFFFKYASYWNSEQYFLHFNICLTLLLYLLLLFLPETNQATQVNMIY